MRLSCPSLEDRVRAETDPSLRDRILSHAADCPDCLTWLQAWEDGLESAARRHLRFGQGSRRSWAILAAGALLALGGVFALWFRQPRAQRPELPAFALIQGEAISGESGEFAADAGQERFLTLPDETRLRLEPGSRVRFLSPSWGERTHLEIVSGAIEAEVTPGKGLFCVVAQAEEIHVLGTHFWAKAFTLSRATACLCTEVYSGQVAIGRGRDMLRIGSGERGMSVGAQPPFKQRIGGDWRETLRFFSGMLQSGPEGFQVPLTHGVQADQLAAILLGSRWDIPLALEESQADTPEVRAAKRILREEQR